jgi:hypothetical protein
MDGTPRPRARARPSPVAFAGTAPGAGLGRPGLAGHPPHGTRKPALPQMFDWIFFAIMIPFPAFLVWDWYRHRDARQL